MTRFDLLRCLIVAACSGGAASLLVLALRRPLRRRCGAGVAYAAWLALPAALLAPLWPIPAPAALVWSPMPGAMPDWAAVPAAQVVAGNADAAGWLLALWLSGASIAALRIFRRQRRFHRALGHVVALGDGVWRAQAGVGLPAAFGLLRPRIVVPADFAERYDRRQRALMLRHERVHIARGDLWVNAFVAVVCCLLWFNPLLHLAAARLREDQELACDARVLARHPRARRAYAQAMLVTQLAAQSTPLGCHWGPPHPLLERIDMLKHPAGAPRWRHLGLLLVAALTGGSAAAAWAAQSAPQAAALAAPAGSVTMEFVARSGGRESRFTIVEAAGQPFSATMFEDGARWRIDGVATVGADKAVYPGSDDDTVWLKMSLLRDGAMVGQPRLAMQSGGSGRVVQEDAAAAGPGKRLELDVRMTAAR